MKGGYMTGPNTPREVDIGRKARKKHLNYVNRAVLGINAQIGGIEGMVNKDLLRLPMLDSSTFRDGLFVVAKKDEEKDYYYGVDYMFSGCTHVMVQFSVIPEETPGNPDPIARDLTVRFDLLPTVKLMVVIRDRDGNHKWVVLVKEQRLCGYLSELPRGWGEIGNLPMSVLDRKIPRWRQVLQLSTDEGLVQLGTPRIEDTGTGPFNRIETWLVVFDVDWEAFDEYRASFPEPDQFSTEYYLQRMLRDSLQPEMDEEVREDRLVSIVPLKDYLQDYEDSCEKDYKEEESRKFFVGDQSTGIFERYLVYMLRKKQKDILGSLF